MYTDGIPCTFINKSDKRFISQEFYVKAISLNGNGQQDRKLTSEKLRVGANRF